MPDISSFKLERYFALYEFKAPYLLSASDCETLSLSELLALANPTSRGLWENLTLGYTESSGHPLLRKAIAGLYPGMSPEDILVSAPEEGIFIFMQSLLDPGDEVIVLSPTYQSLLEIGRSIGCKVIPWQLKIGQSGWTLDLEWLERNLTSQTRLLVINFPHNPTGFLPTLPEFERVVALARQNGVMIFSDEMYRLIEHNPARLLPAMCDLYENGISLSGMSKAFGLPGLRIGWLATRAANLMKRWIRYKDYTTICNSAPSEILAILALEAREEILKRNLEIIRNNLALAEDFFSGDGRPFRWLAPTGGSVAFPGWNGEGTVEDFCQALIDRKGVMVVPGSLFEFPGSHFRIGLGRKNFPEALQKVKESDF